MHVSLNGMQVKVSLVSLRIFVRLGDMSKREMIPCLFKPFEQDPLSP